MAVPANSLIAERVLSGNDCYGIKVGCVTSDAVNEHSVDAAKGLLSQAMGARDAEQTNLYTQLKDFLVALVPGAPQTPVAAHAPSLST